MIAALSVMAVLRISFSQDVEFVVMRMMKLRLRKEEMLN